MLDSAAGVSVTRLLFRLAVVAVSGVGLLLVPWAPAGRNDRGSVQPWVVDRIKVVFLLGLCVLPDVKEEIGAGVQSWFAGLAYSDASQRVAD